MVLSQGAKNGWVLLSDALKKGTVPEEAPFPAGLVSDVVPAAEAAG